MAQSKIWVLSASEWNRILLQKNLTARICLISINQQTASQIKCSIAHSSITEVICFSIDLGIKIGQTVTWNKIWHFFEDRDCTRILVGSHVALRVSAASIFG
jgi:hypothetical protein